MPDSTPQTQTTMSPTPLLDTVTYPAELRRLDKAQLRQFADELRHELIDAVSVSGGHFGAGWRLCSRPGEPGNDRG